VAAWRYGAGILGALAVLAIGKMLVARRAAPASGA
jgi:hypothetical protein